MLHYIVNWDFYEYLTLPNDYWHLHSILYKAIGCQGKLLFRLSGIACQINSAFLPVSFGKLIIDNAKHSKTLFLMECSVHWVWNSTKIQHIHVWTVSFIPSHFHSMPFYKLLSEIDFKILPCENTNGTLVREYQEDKICPVSHFRGAKSYYLSQMQWELHVLSASEKHALL